MPLPERVLARQILAPFLIVARPGSGCAGSAGTRAKMLAISRRAIAPIAAVFQQTCATSISALLHRSRVSRTRAAGYIQQRANRYSTHTIAKAPTADSAESIRKGMAG